MLVVSLPTIVTTHHLGWITTDNSGSSTGGGTTTTTDNSGSSTPSTTTTDNSGSSSTGGGSTTDNSATSSTGSVDETPTTNATTSNHAEQSSNATSSTGATKNNASSFSGFPGDEKLSNDTRSLLHDAYNVGYDYGKKSDHGDDNSCSELFSFLVREGLPGYGELPGYLYMGFVAGYHDKVTGKTH